MSHPKARSEPNGEERTPLPPDGGYGWVCVAACFTVNCFTWGAVSSYGIYLSHYLTTDTFPDATPIDFAFIGGFNFAIAMLVAPGVTVLARMLGIHCTMSLGVIMQAVGYIAASFADKIWQLYLTQGVLVGLGVSFLYVPSVAVLSQWFEQKRSIANGIAAAGSGVGGVMFTWATEAMIQNLSLAWALRSTGLVTFVAALIAVALIRDRNRHIRPRQLPLDLNLLRRYDIRMLLSWTFISMLGYITLLFSLSDFAISIGLSRIEATNILGLLNLGTAIGRPVIGIWSDRYSRIDIATALTLFTGLCCFAFWVPATNYGLTLFFAIVIGATIGVFWVTIGPLCVEVAGLKHLPSLLSLSWVTAILPTTFSEVIALKLRRPNASRPYLYVQIFAGLSYVVASLFLFELRRVQRKASSLRRGGQAQ